MAHVLLRDSTDLAVAPYAGVESAALRFVVDSGWRPIVTATIEGVEVPMLVHGNAGFVAMLTHDALARVTGRRVDKERDFGLGHDLALSSAGRGHLTLDSLTVAGHSMADVRFEVFDLPTVNWEGMLGVDWLAATGAIVDFGLARLSIPGAGNRRERQSAAVGRRLDLEREERSGRFCCRLAAARGEVGRFVVSTVAETTFDLGYARRLGLDLGDPVEVEHGPTGAVVPVHRLRTALTLTAGGDEIRDVTPSVYDVYAYAGSDRPADAQSVAGYIGADLLLRERAVVDFG